MNPNWVLSFLVRIANEDRKVAAVSARMVSMKVHRLLDSVSVMGIPYWRGFVDIGKQEPDSGQFPDSFEPFAFCGGAALFRKSVFVELGGFDREMFLYYEDPDLSWRLRLLGWTVRYAPNLYGYGQTF